MVVGAFSLSVSGTGMSKAPDHMGQVMICVGSPFHTQHPLLNLVQLVAPLAVAGRLLRRDSAPAAGTDLNNRLAA
jgi:hypothetical protein